MVDKKMLALLTVLAFYSVLVNSQTERINELRLQSVFLGEKIAREEALSERRDSLPEVLREVTSLDKNYRTKVFSAERDDGTALGEMQRLLQDKAKMANLEFIRASWGEPYNDESGLFVVLPMSCVVSGAPATIDTFLRSIYLNEKLLTVETASLNRTQGNRLLLNLSIYGYKLLILPKQ